MEIEEFVIKVRQQDCRNVFEPFLGDTSFIPLVLVQMYIMANPIDVEVRTKKYGNIHFCPLERVKYLKKDYSFLPNDCFVFASANGEPFFVKDGSIFVSQESVYVPEYISDKISDFFDVIRIL